jgi:FixJ family two-component response regulator
MTDTRPRVYIVDDDASVRRALARVVRCAGHPVETFPSAGAFLEQERPAEPGCLVLDATMPGLSGLGLQEKLAEEARPIPVVFISGESDVPTSVRAMKAGAVDFLCKPVRGPELLSAIDEALDRDQRTRAREAEVDEVRRRFDALTAREQEVMALVVMGLMNKQIAARLGTCEKTIKVHRARVMEKMQAESVPDLVRMAEKVGLAAEKNVALSLF